MRWVPDQRVRHSPDRCVYACLDLLIAWSLETCCFGLATSPHIRAAQLNLNMPSARSIFRLFLERKWLTLMRFSQVESSSKHAPWLSSSSIMFCWTLLLICSKCGIHAYLLIQQAITVSWSEMPANASVTMLRTSLPAIWCLLQSCILKETAMHREISTGYQK